MTLSELINACRLYEQLTDYDASLKLFRSSVAPVFDPLRAQHRSYLLKWLNSWGCRQFAIDDHPIASASLENWAKIWLDRLPPPDEHLTDTTPSQIRACFEAYEALSAMLASRRTLPDGKTSSVTFGPTGAAKTLFALRPLLVPPWDEPIRKRLERDGVRSFRAYLAKVAEQLRSLSLEAGVPVSEIPKLVGRPNSSPPKLIDEYNWVVYTRGLMPAKGV